MRTWQWSECRHDPSVMFAILDDAPQYGDDSHMHGHVFSEIVVVTGGKGIHSLLGGEEHSLEKGDVFVIHGDMVHGYRYCESLELVNIIFDPKRALLPLEYLSLIPGYHTLFRLDPRYSVEGRSKLTMRLNDEELKHVSGFISIMRDELKGSKVGYEAQLQSIFLQLVVYLSRKCTEIPKEAVGQNKQIISSLNAIESRYQEPLSTSELAGLSHMSVNHFIRVFKGATGVTPLEYLSRFRIRKAVQLLADSGISITEISFLVGYNDVCRFSRQFKKMVGYSPREYRRHIR